MEIKEGRRGRNHSQRKSGIAAGHVRVVDYISSRISAKVSGSLALPSSESSSARTLYDSFSVPHKYHRQK